MNQLLRPRSWLLGALALAVAHCGGDSSGSYEYVAIGASDAVGIGASPLTNGYVFRIQDGLKSDGLDVGLLNLGIPSAESDEIANVALPVAVDEEPELVTVFVGANDIVRGVSLADFRNDLGEILSTLRDETSALVVIATIPQLQSLPRFQDEPDPDVTAERVAAFNAAIRELAADSGTVLVELSDEALTSTQVSDDGFHPSDTGHETIANSFLSTIRTVQGR